MLHKDVGGVTTDRWSVTHVTLEFSGVLRTYSYINHVWTSSAEVVHVVVPTRLGCYAAHNENLLFADMVSWSCFGIYCEVFDDEQMTFLIGCLTLPYTRFVHVNVL